MESNGMPSYTHAFFYKPSFVIGYWLLATDFDKYWNKDSKIPWTLTNICITIIG